MTGHWDDFLMNALASNTRGGEAFCRRLLSVLLQKKIGKVHIVAQKALFPENPNQRVIRMDVEVRELAPEELEDTESIDGEVQEHIANVYDIEPHLKDDWHLPKRNRFYQVKIDPEVKVGYMKFEEIIRYERWDAALEAKVQDILELLEEYDVILEEVKERLNQEKDVTALKKWHKLAARVDSIEEFVLKMDRP